jgi:hypothetical protein
MEYRGIKYNVVQSIQRGIWKWTTSVVGVVVMGQASSRTDAIAAAEKAIDRALRKKSGSFRLRPNERSRIRAGIARAIGRFVWRFFERRNAGTHGLPLAFIKRANSRNALACTAPSPPYPIPVLGGAVLGFFRIMGDGQCTGGKCRRVRRTAKSFTSWSQF